MFANVKNYTDCLQMVTKCETKKDIVLAFNHANHLRCNFGLTEFEYLAFEEELLRKINQPTSLSQYRGHLNIQDLLNKSDFASDKK